MTTDVLTRLADGIATPVDEHGACRAYVGGLAQPRVYFRVGLTRQYVGPLFQASWRGQRDALALCRLLNGRAGLQREGETVEGLAE